MPLLLFNLKKKKTHAFFIVIDLNTTHTLSRKLGENWKSCFFSAFPPFPMSYPFSFTWHTGLLGFLEVNIRYQVVLANITSILWSSSPRASPPKAKYSVGHAWVVPSVRKYGKRSQGRLLHYFSQVNLCINRWPKDLRRYHQSQYIMTA